MVGCVLVGLLVLLVLSACACPDRVVACVVLGQISARQLRAVVVVLVMHEELVREMTEVTFTIKMKETTQKTFKLIVDNTETVKSKFAPQLLHAKFVDIDKFLKTSFDDDAWYDVGTMLKGCIDGSDWHLQILEQETYTWSPIEALALDTIMKLKPQKVTAAMQELQRLVGAAQTLADRFALSASLKVPETDGTQLTSSLNEYHEKLKFLKRTHYEQCLLGIFANQRNNKLSLKTEISKQKAVCVNDIKNCPPGETMWDQFHKSMHYFERLAYKRQFAVAMEAVGSEKKEALQT